MRSTIFRFIVRQLPDFVDEGAISAYKHLLSGRIASKIDAMVVSPRYIEFVEDFFNLRKVQPRAIQMTSCFLVSDLHGSIARYRKLFDAISKDRPDAVFLGGDLLPHPLASGESPYHDFVNDFLAAELAKLQNQMREAYPRIFIIMGNDDIRLEETKILDMAKLKICEYIHNRKVALADFCLYGYAYVPPTPFQLKDWERYDISRYVDPGCVSPEEGLHSIPVQEHELRYATIARDLEKLTGDDELSQAVFLFHTPPYQTKLDRAALDGKMIDQAPLDVHVGSIAVKRFIETRQPLVTLHGHIHESARLTGSWKERIGRTFAFSAAHDGPELALVRFELEQPENAFRELL